MRQRAVLVGINQYASEVSLAGPINDVDGIRQLLVEVAGYADADVHVLTNSSANRTDILSELAWLTADLRKGDRALFHFSGHGVPFPGHNAVHDGLAPYDYSESPPVVLLGSDFRSVFGAVPDGVLLTWIADACFSGGIPTFENAFARIFRFGRKRHASRSRALPPGRRAMELLAHGVRPVPITGSPSEPPLNVAIITAADDLASDNPKGEAPFDATPYGALTYYLLAALRDVASRSKPLNELTQDVVTALHRFIPDQTPALHGNPALRLQPFLGGIGNAPFNAHRFNINGEPFT
jgi:metacaspase-1